MSKRKKGSDMQQHTWFLLCAGGIVGGIILFSRLYRWWMKSKRVTTSTVMGWQTPPQPEPYLIGFQEFYIQLCRHDVRFQYTYSQAKRLYAISLLPMYKTASREEALEQPGLLDEYDIEIEVELIVAALEEKGA